MIVVKCKFVWLPVQLAKFNALKFDIQNKGMNERRTAALAMPLVQNTRFSAA